MDSDTDVFTESREKYIKERKQTLYKIMCNCVCNKSDDDDKNNDDDDDDDNNNDDNDDNNNDDNDDNDIDDDDNIKNCSHRLIHVIDDVMSDNSEFMEERHQNVPTFYTNLISNTWSPLVVDDLIKKKESVNFFVKLCTKDEQEKIKQIELQSNERKILFDQIKELKQKIVSVDEKILELQKQIKQSDTLDNYNNTQCMKIFVYEPLQKLNSK